MIRKPKLGQNFLIDDRARHAIAEALGDTFARTVIEIGPGHGAITAILAPRCRRLIAIELDRALAAELRFKFRDQPHVEILEADILTTDLVSLLERSNPSGDTTAAETMDVVGNLPYYITSDILFHLCAAASAIARAVLMMQREVADRVAASPGVRDYGLLSATTQMYARVEWLFTLPPSAFSPPPEVFSSVIRLEFAPRFAELAVDPLGFDRFLKQAFAQKRKTLANNLRFAGHDPSAFTAAWPSDLPPQARAEEIPLEQMAALYRNLRSPSL
jgi:16S rRNA (adenine1518-N6/adenine1519-N6)-dimethyltransferase